MNRLPRREEKPAKWALEPRLWGLKGILCLLLWVTNRVLHLHLWVRSSRVEEIRLVSGVAPGVHPLQVERGQARVDLGAAQGAVAQQLLHVGQRGALL